MCLVRTMIVEVSEQSRSQFYTQSSGAAAAAAAAAAPAAAVCCYTALAAAVLLLLAAVRHSVPDGQICCWFNSLNLIPVFSFPPM